jgi:ribosomal protein L37AE/L43A
MKNLSLYIEGKNYPRTKVRSGLSTIDRENLRLSKVFPNIAEYEMFKKGRAFFASRFGSRPAREGFPSKVGTRVGTIVLVRQNNKVTKQYQHQVCDECGSNDIRLDSRGYKYCTQCFLIQ